MRFIDGEGAAKRMAGVALLDAGIFPEQLFRDAFRRGFQNRVPSPIAGKLPTSLDLAFECFAGGGEGFPGMMNNGPRDFLAGLAGCPLVNSQGDLLVPQFGSIEALREAGRYGVHGAKSGRDEIRSLWLWLQVIFSSGNSQAPGAGRRMRPVGYGSAAGGRPVLSTGARGPKTPGSAGRRTPRRAARAGRSPRGSLRR